MCGRAAWLGQWHIFHGGYIMTSCVGTSRVATMPRGAVGQDRAPAVPAIASAAPQMSTAGAPEHPAGAQVRRVGLPIDVAASERIDSPPRFRPEVMVQGVPPIN